MSTFDKIVSEIPLVGPIVNEIEVLIGEMTPQEALKYQIHRYLNVAGGFALGAWIGIIASTGISISSNLMDGDVDQWDSWVMNLSDSEAKTILQALHSARLIV